MSRRRRDRAGDPAFTAALRDLTEFGWVSVPNQGLAQRLYRAAVEAGQKARIVKITDRGWWTVEITDMRPRKEVGNGG